MSEAQRLWDELRRAATRAEDIPGPDSPEARRVFNAVIAGEERRRRRVRVIRTVAIAVLALALIAAVVIRFAFVSDPTSIACFEAVDIDANRAVTFVTHTPTVDDCAEWWLNGELSNPQWPSGEVPPMVACTGPGGVLWAFPTDDANVCQTLGLANPEAIPDDHPVVAIQEALRDKYTWDACVPPARAITEITQILDQLGLDEWNVELTSTLPGDCTTISIDPDRSTIVIVPLPPRG